ncbi:Eco57I restriction-modification methylase domain-containing protein [Candidatus Hecatella orcuttiae]|uniref:Eco57I restriction-modification methylase domain-containing protein n=1 Tax=Candidatus Hecatella orcuttiae TaxID=1935119 RepID=UPI002868214C|nr:N-6 DNA methylase [Candidatus Hecatella orcuttiae]
MNTLGELLKGKNPEEVSKIKVLDPACGSGSFLIKAFDALKEYYDWYNKTIEKKALGSIAEYGNLIQDVEKRIVIENLFGVDLDPQAAEIAAVNLMLKALKKGERLPLILGDNIKCGNSLISGSEKLREYFGDDWSLERPFNWEKEYVEVFKEGGFDVVVGNPPHGAKLSQQERDFFFDVYQVAKGYKNSASLFIERATQLLKPLGTMGLVIPKSLTFSEKWKATREFILQNLRLIEIVDISKAFPGVLLEQIIIICRKDPMQSSSYKGTSLTWERILETYTIPLSLCKELDIFPIHVDQHSLTIYKKVMKKSFQLKEISKTFRGLPVQSKATIIQGENSEPLLRGDDIKRYYHATPQTFIDRDALKEDSKKITDMRKPKIISQRIIAHVLKPKDRIIIMSTIDEEGLLNVDTVENTILTDPQYDLKYILAFLNSKLVSWFTYTFIFNKAVRTMDFDDYYVGKIPIYPATPDQQKLITEVVQKMLTLTSRIKEIDTDFQKRVNSIPREKDTTFKDYYLKYSSDRTPLIPSNVKGQIKSLKVEEQGHQLVIKVDYIEKDGNREKQHSDVEVFRCEIENEPIRKFLFYSVSNYGKTLGSGNIWYKIQNIPLAKFHKNEGQNEKVVVKLINDYLRAINNRRLLQQEIQATDKILDEKIYKLYDLNQDEISLIESSIQRYFVEESFYI